MPHTVPSSPTNGADEPTVASSVSPPSRRMLSRATDFLPALSRAPVIRCWTGFRPATPDKLPLIGRWESTPGLWIAAGHEGLGITTSLGTARLIADQIAGRPTAIRCDPFAPMRAVSAEHV